MKKFLASLHIVILGLIPAGALAGSGQINISKAWIQEAPPSSTVHGGFMTILNRGDEAMTITSVESPSYEEVQMHKSEEKDGMASMIRQKELKIPAHSVLELKPGSYHLMLMKPEKKMKAGDEVKLIIHFSNGEQISQIATVQKKSDAMSGMDHSTHMDHSMH